MKTLTKLSMRLPVLRKSSIAPVTLADLPAAPATGTALLRIDDLPDHGGKEIIFTEDRFRTSIFIQKTNQTIAIYVNQCPHAGTPLNMFGDRFVDTAGLHLICRTHGALFDPESGICVAGPCKGQHLRPVAHTIKDGVIYSAA